MEWVTVTVPANPAPGGLVGSTDYPDFVGDTDCSLEGRPHSASQLKRLSCPQITQMTQKEVWRFIA